jgi:hypothetical protein
VLTFDENKALTRGALQLAHPACEPSVVKWTSRMIASLSLALLAFQCHSSNEVVWMKGFTFHHSQQLSSGLVLLTEAGFYSQGNRDRVRLTWFRHTASGFKNLMAFEGMATLDDLPPKVQGDWVRLRTVDEPHLLMVSAGRLRCTYVSHDSIKPPRSKVEA